MTSQTTQTFALPDVGEGLTEAEIVSWHVAPGDVVVVNQTIVDIETAKSIVELPSPFAGMVIELLAAVGDTVPVGQPIVAVDTASEGGGEAPPAPASSQTQSPSTTERQPKLLVGYGAPDSSTMRSRRRSSASSPATSSPAPVGATGQVARNTQSRRPRAAPPVRKLAKVLGVDLGTVEPSGPDMTIIRSDVLGASRDAGAGGHDTGVQNQAVTRDPSLAAAVRVEQRIAIKGIRKHTAAAMVSSAFTAPHVTEFLTIDITKTVELRDVVQKRREFRDVRLTPLAFVAKAYLRAMESIPMAKGHWQDQAQEIVIPAGVNLGIAVATPRGLIVPNIKDADRLDLLGLANAINYLAATARDGRTPPGAMAGGTTTITNVGVFGIDTGTPILNPGETAILAVGAIRRRPWVVQDDRGERMEPRSIMQLSLSFDHRVIDGQEGSQLLAATGATLVEPGLAAL